jgi:hypothetical protein
MYCRGFRIAMLQHVGVHNCTFGCSDETMEQASHTYVALGPRALVLVLNIAIQRAACQIYKLF